MQDTYETKVPKVNRKFRTYVFEIDHTPEKGREEFKNMLGEDYKGMTPVVACASDELEIGAAALELLRKIRDGQCDDVETEGGYKLVYNLTKF